MKKIILHGKLIKPASLKTKKAFLNISKKNKDKISFQSQGLVVSFNGGGDVSLSHPFAKEAAKLASWISENGGIVLNGGRNTGIMESSSKAAGKSSFGIIFPEQKKLASQYGQKAIVRDSKVRMVLLTTCPPIVVVFPGSIGTALEMMNVIVTLKDNLKYKKINSPLLFIHHYWKNWLSFFLSKKNQPRAVKKIIYFNKSSEVIKRLKKL